MKKILTIGFSILAILASIFYYLNQEPKKIINNQKEEITTTTRIKRMMLEEVPAEEIQLANPASQYCEEKGGEIQIRTDINKGEYGVCVFEDNKQCEE